MLKKLNRWGGVVLYLLASLCFFTAGCTGTRWLTYLADLFMVTGLTWTVLYQRSYR